MNTTFDYVDRLFNGLVYFVLNLVESIVSLYRNPVRGTLRLTARSLNVNSRQASYRTLLFFINAVMYVVMGSLLETIFGGQGESFIENVISVSERPNLISTIIYATIATAVIELYTKHRFAGHSKLRHTNVVQIRLGYAFCFIVSLFLILQTIWLLSLFWVPNAINSLTLILIPVMFFVGAAAITPIIRMPAMVGAFFVLILSQLISWAAVIFYTQATSKQQLEILYLSCQDKSQDRMDVVALVANRTDEEMIVRFPDDVQLFGIMKISHFKDYKPHMYKVILPEAKQYAVIEPKKTTTLELKAEHSDPQYPLCGLRIDAFSNTTKDVLGRPRSDRQFRAITFQAGG